MGAIASLTDMTTSERELVDHMTRLTGTEYYLNSGVLDRDDFISDFDKFNTLTVTDKTLGSLIQKGARELISRLEIIDTTILKPHLHRGGELAFVLSGSYSDINEGGDKLADYSESDVVLYTRGSVHIPMAEKPALIIYRAFDGIYFGAELSDLLSEMQRRGLPQINQDFVRNVLMKK